MPLQNDTPMEGQYTPHDGMQGPNRRLLTGYTYPDSASHGTQTLQGFHSYNGWPQPTLADAMAIEPSNPPLPDRARHDMSLADPHHGMVHYGQSQATYLVTNSWGGHGVSPYAANTANDGIILDPTLRGNDFWSRQAMKSNQQMLQAASWGNQYIGSSFRGTNMPAQGTNRVTEDYASSFYTPSPPYIPLLNPNEHGKSQPSGSERDAHRHGQASEEGTSVTQRSEKRRRSARIEKAAPAQSAQGPGPVEPRGAATASTRGRSTQLSQLGQKKARFGDRMGDDHKPKSEIKVEHGIMYGLVDNEWRPAGYHRQFRSKLILLDAQQPGAPVWQEGMSENITSYSPLIRDWTEDPHSIKDSKGRELMFMAARPQDLTHNPECGYLMCEGLVMLDHNNRPIKAYPGAPRTLAVDSTEPRAFLLEGLRRVLGMTLWDLRARMPGAYDSQTRLCPLQTPSVFTNRVISWRKLKNLNAAEENLGPWHKRRTPKTTTSKGSSPHDLSNEGEPTTKNTTEGTYNPVDSPSFPAQFTPFPQNTNDFELDSHSSAFSPRNLPMQMSDDLGSDEVKWDDFEDLEEL